MGQWTWYAVQKGRQPGLYRTWEDCAAQVKGFPGARFKGCGCVELGTAQERQWALDDSDTVVVLLLLITEAWIFSACQECQWALDDSAAFVAEASSLFGAAAAALSTLPTSSPSSKFYAVATGRKPGVYLTWRECEAQVRGFVGARYKSFASRDDAVEFLAVYGGGGHFSQFESESFRPDHTASFSEEFGRLSSSQGWVPGSQRYKEERVRALHNELRTHYFSAPVTVKEEDHEDDDRPLAGIKEEKDDAATEPPVSIKEEEEEEEPDETLVSINEQLSDLQGFQSMCRAVGKAPADTLGGCREILNETLVNLVDLVDGRRIGAKVEVWTDFEAFRRYTLKDKKRMPLHEAAKDPLLAVFLQYLRNPRPRRRAVKRGRSPCRGLLFPNVKDEPESKRRRVDWYDG
ncbi:hypothetical protein VMCG_03830 [Cytospora schulzeri]|uniref:ribonuclease H n=1 Tax=Cytospora schulzeri TaxID=448051 RepID=A0A423WUW5_9PEZI|nr:hypothetical protein VMCG_03830 [Valsa malicola]